MTFLKITNERFEVIYQLHNFENHKSYYKQEKPEKNPFWLSLISENLGRFFIRQILDGLFYLRNAMVIHQDIKPENIFLNKVFNLKIGDFAQVQLPNQGKLMELKQCGSFNYFMAPQYFHQHNFVSSSNSYKMDIYSVGVIAFYIFRREYPISITKEKFQKVESELKFQTLVNELEKTFKLIDSNEFNASLELKEFIKS